MKTAFRFLGSIFCLFLFALTTTTLAQIPLDVDGVPLRNGGKYYIQPTKGGGLELARTGNQTCPSTVVQSCSGTSIGLPAKLSSPIEIPFITTELLLNIEFTLRHRPRCLPSTSKWKMEEESQTVKITSEREGDKRVAGSFKIKTEGDDYKLVYCNTESQGTSDCKGLGISIDADNNWCLAVKDRNPLAVQFVKADRKDNYSRPSSI